MAESIMQQRSNERQNYAFRLLTPLSIQLIRKPSCQRDYCEDCKEEATCQTCSDSSPITKFRRLRTITLTPASGRSGYFMKCSCLHHADSGLPCQHMCVVLDVKPHHVFIRWHKKYAALFGRRGSEALTDQMRLQRCDRRLFILPNEYQQIISFVKSKSVEFNPDLFMVPHSKPFQRCLTGLLSYEEAHALYISESMGASVFDVANNISQSSMLSQELGLPDEEESSSLTTTSSSFPIAFENYHSGNAYKDLCAKFAMAHSHAKGWPDLFAKFCNTVTMAMSELEHAIQYRSAKKCKLNETGLYHSSYVEQTRSMKHAKQRRYHNHQQRNTANKKQTQSPVLDGNESGFV